VVSHFVLSIIEEYHVRYYDGAPQFVAPHLRYIFRRCSLALLLSVKYFISVLKFASFVKLGNVVCQIDSYSS